MSRDQFQDVFPIAFDFKKGEQPTAIKLTGMIKQTDTAFSRITRGVGDPWDYQSGNHPAELSPQKLAQASLARIIGPSDYISPTGGCWEEETASVSVTLKSGRNSWSLGYPLVSVGALSPNNITPNSSAIAPLTWAAPPGPSDIVVAIDNDSVLNTSQCKTDLEDVIIDGDWHIDFYTGVITSYKVSISNIVLTISNINLFGPGVPWGTHNVIPSWEEPTSLCDIAWVSDTATASTWTLTLPTMNCAPRIDTGSLVGGTHKMSTTADASYTDGFSGQGTQYRLPYSITENFSASDQLPEGFVYLWENTSPGRIIPQVTFTYFDEHTLTLTTPLNWLTTGDATYRLVLSGTSLAESVNYLMNVVRDNRCVGITTGASGPNTLAYTPPISHDDLDDLYTGSNTNEDLYKFAKSNINTNPHPQYLHRTGYIEDDLVGNSANAMRGDLVFASDDDYLLSGGVISGTSGCRSNTYGIYFGGWQDVAANANNPSLSFKGGVDIDTWTSGAAIKIGFGIEEVGATNQGADYYGAVTFTPWYGTPLFLQGSIGVAENGAVLGFDMGQNNELNYIKLLHGTRDGTNDVENMPANTSQTETSLLDLTTSLTASFKRLSPHQIREFRFRGVSSVTTSMNSTGGIGGKGSSVQSALYTIASASNPYTITLSAAHGDVSSTFTLGKRLVVSGGANAGTYHINFSVFGVATVITLDSNTPLPAYGSIAGEFAKSVSYEFDDYFVSPGIVGADYFNVYSNAIFFSDQGDGKMTSFTDIGDTWLNLGTDTPTGIYYKPGASSYYQFVSHESTTERNNILKVGYEYGLLSTTDKFDIRAWDTFASYGNGRGGSTAGASMISAGTECGAIQTHRDLDLFSGQDLSLRGNRSVSIVCDGTGEYGNISMNAATYIAINSTSYISIGASTGDINIDAAIGGIKVEADNDTTISSINGDVNIRAYTGDIILVGIASTGYTIVPSSTATNKPPVGWKWLVYNTSDGRIGWMSTP